MMNARYCYVIVRFDGRSSFLNQLCSIIYIFDKIYHHNVIVTASFWISKYVPKSPYPNQEKKNVYLPTTFSLFLQGGLTAQRKALELDKVWFESQLYLLWVKWSWASDASAFHTFPRAELPADREAYREVTMISQLSAGIWGYGSSLLHLFQCVII